MTAASESRLRGKVRAIPDFPAPGIIFRDLTPLMGDAQTLRLGVEAMIEPFTGEGVELVAGMEARGFIFGAIAAHRLGAGFLPLRKPGKLPHRVESASYRLEYGAAALEMHVDGSQPGTRVLVVDDLLATGGTAKATLDLLARARTEVVGLAFLIELAGLGGREALAGARVHAVLHY